MPKIIEEVQEKVQEVQEEAAPDETKAEAFVRLTNKRVSKTLDEIRKIGNLSNRSQYEYTDEQVTKIFGAIAQACEEEMRKFFKNGKKKREFSL